MDKESHLPYFGPKYDFFPQENVLMDIEDKIRNTRPNIQSFPTINKESKQSYVEDPTYSINKVYTHRLETIRNRFTQIDKI
jgi:hypothetical protein